MLSFKYLGTQSTSLQFVETGNKMWYCCSEAN